MFSFTPLLGAQSNSPAVQSLLEFDGGIKILVDVGWDESFDAEKLRDLERQVPTLSLILLTHATISHLGAYAHCCKHIPLFHQIPVYATEPVKALGRTLTQDLYTSTPLAASLLPQSSIVDTAYSLLLTNSHHQSNILLPAPSSEDVAGFFSSINTLRYSQVHQPIPSPWSPPIDGLTITAYCAGHTLGGTIWHIQHGSESVVYAVDWNQARENALPGAAWLGGSGATGAEIVEQLRKPTALICSSKGSGIVAPPGGLKRRDELLLEHIRATIKEGGSVLIPCDTSARVLELAYTLERAWNADSSNRSIGTLHNAKLFLISPTCESTMQEARRMLEWMDESVVSEFELASGRQQDGRESTQRDGQSQAGLPFIFKDLKLVERQTQVMRLLAAEGPKVILASDTSLEWGFSRSVFRQFAVDSRNLVLLVNPLPTKSTFGSSSPNLLENIGKLLRPESSDAANDKDTLSRQCRSDELDLREVHTVALTGNDLAIYQQYLAQQRQRQNTFSADKSRNLESSADVVDEESASSSSSSEDSDPERQGKVLNMSAALAHSKHKLVDVTDEELGINILLRRKNVHDYDVRGKRGREKMFPFVAKRRRIDDFGDVIRPEDYLRAEERDEVDGQDMSAEPAKDNTALGQKRKWNDGEAGRSNGRRRSSTNLGKRRKVDNQGRNSGVNGDANGTAVEDEESDESEYEPEEPIVRGPTQAIFSTQTLQLQMKLAAMDFFGIHDRRTLNMLLPLIRPRKLILTGGTEDETLSLAEDCRRLLASVDSATSKSAASDILTPTIGTSVDASVDTNAWTIKLTQSLYKRLRWQNFRGLGIVTLHGRLELPATSDTDEKMQKRRKVEDGEELTPLAKSKSAPQDSVLPILTEIPEGSTVSRPVSEALHVGDLRLAELRKIMQASGHTAEFKGEGTLLVDGMIAVRKSGVGRIEVESGGPAVTGPAARMPGASFYDVRRRIYEGLAVVAAR